MEVRNRFKGLDLIDKVPDELWTEVCNTEQGAVIKTIPKKKKCKQGKWLSKEALKIADKSRREKQGRKGKISNGMQSSREQQGEIRKPS